MHHSPHAMSISAPTERILRSNHDPCICIYIRDSRHSRRTTNHKPMASPLLRLLLSPTRTCRAPCSSSAPVIGSPIFLLRRCICREGRWFMRMKKKSRGTSRLRRSTAATYFLVRGPCQFGGSRERPELLLSRPGRMEPPSSNAMMP